MFAAICVVVLCAATAGLTYGMVNLAKDTRVVNGIMTVKDTQAPISTGPRCCR